MVATIPPTTEERLSYMKRESNQYQTNMLQLLIKAIQCSKIAEIAGCFFPATFSL